MTLRTMIRSCFGWPTWGKRPPAMALADYPFRSSEKLRFADTDKNGHVSNAVFAVCCQNARMEILHDRARVPLPIHAQFVIARLELEFLDEMHWPGTVEIGTRLDRLGRSSLTLTQSLFLEDRPVANARSTVVLVDPSTRRPTPLPHETATALRAVVGTAAASTRRNGIAAPPIPSRTRSTAPPQPQQRTE